MNIDGVKNGIVLDHIKAVSYTHLKCVRNVLGGKTVWDTNDGSADNAKGML